MVKRFGRWTVIAGATVFVAMQLWPYGRNHTNPSVRMEPRWDSAETRELAVRACFDCHSNETIWPWYSNIAPLSWLIQSDVDQARKKLNYSEWDRLQEDARESAETVRKGTMPQWDYAIVHPRAKLSPEERQALIRGLEATFGSGGQEKREKHEKRREGG